MPITTYKPTTPGQRGMTTQDFDQITKSRPAKSLTNIIKKNSGRNNQGRITTRHQGGGQKRFYRQISFSLPDNYQGKVTAIEYDPNRSARIALIESKDGKLSYIIATSKMKVGQKISAGDEAGISEGNRMPLMIIPVGSQVHLIELEPGKGAQLVRSAGSSATLMGRDGDGYAQIRMPSGEVRLVNENCQASLGVIGNEQHQNVSIGKAGRNRHRGIRPSVRGVVMNAVDHPHGGGDGGRHGVGGGKDFGAAPKTPWGQKTLGYKTRSRKSTNKYIIRSRHQAKRS